MARQTKTVTIETRNRDLGKTFQITEMSASQAERWAGRAFTGITRSGVEVPTEMLQSGFGGIAAIGMQALLSMSFQDAEPLMDELMSCVTVRPDAENPAIERKLVEADIEEVMTRWFLKMEVFELHTGFSPAAALSRIAAAFNFDMLKAA